MVWAACLLFGLRSGSPLGWRTPMSSVRSHSLRLYSRSKSINTSSRVGVTTSSVNIDFSTGDPRVWLVMGANARIVQPLPASVVDRVATDTNPMGYDSTDFQIPCFPMNCPRVDNDKVLVKTQSESA